MQGEFIVQYSSSKKKKIILILMLILNGYNIFTGLVNKWPKDTSYG